MTSTHLGTDSLYTEIRNEIEDMSDYLETDTLRRQANTVVRLTVVTSFGLIGTVATGFLGMNLFSLSELTTIEKIVYFIARAGPGHGAHVLHDPQVEAAVRLPRIALGRAAAAGREAAIRC